MQYVVVKVDLFDDPLLLIAVLQGSTEAGAGPRLIIFFVGGVCFFETRKAFEVNMKYW